MNKKSKYKFALGTIATLTIGLYLMLQTSFTIGKNYFPPIGSFVSLLHSFWANATDFTTGDQLHLKIPGLNDVVNVSFDERLVLHIFAKNTADAYSAMGYIHAQNRLFQMDLISRSASGRLAEVLGERLVKRDKNQRR